MSAALYVLKCPEFEPLVDAANRSDGISVDDWGHYRRLSSAGVLRLERAGTNLIDAIWFAAPTGGIQGRIRRFTDALLEIDADSPGSHGD